MDVLDKFALEYDKELNDCYILVNELVNNRLVTLCQNFQKITKKLVEQAIKKIPDSYDTYITDKEQVLKDYKVPCIDILHKLTKENTMYSVDIIDFISFLNKKTFNTDDMSWKEEEVYLTILLAICDNIDLFIQSNAPKYFI